MKIAAISLGSFLALIVLLVIVVTTFDWNRAKPWLNAKVSEATGREFAINGDLSLSWHRGENSREEGWRRLVPWPQLSAQDITFGNPEWADASPNMATVRRVTFSINPLALLTREISIPLLELERPDITLQRAADGSNNWTFKPKEDKPSPWQLQLRRLRLDEGSVRIVDAIKKADVKAKINSLEQRDEEGNRVAWTLSGKFNGAPVSGQGRSGGILALQRDTRPYPVTAEVKVGKTAISLAGTMTRPRDLAALDVRLKVSGPSMAQLYSLSGVLLPETPPYSTEGHLTGTLDDAGGEWKYEKFKGKVGESDLAGTLEFRAGKDGERRPYLRGELVSQQLRLVDLGPLIGADSNESKVSRGARPVQPPDRVLPVQAFRTDRWNAVDADVIFTGKKIVRDESLPIDNLHTELHLKSGVLSLTPLNFGVAGGDLRSTIRLDGRERTIKAEMKIAARHLALKQLFPKVEAMSASLGEINGDVSLSATGNSIAAMLGSANGEVKALMNHGTVSKLVLEAIGLNLGSVIVTKLFGDRQVQINCMAGDFTVKDGLMDTRAFVVDTEEALVFVDGRVDMVNEKLDLVIDPKSRELRIVSLHSPIFVEGSFKKPKVDVDRGKVAARAGGAIALGVLAPIATALLPLINPGKDQQSGCHELLKDAAAKTVAPAPGKTYQPEQADRQRERAAKQPSKEASGAR